MWMQARGSRKAVRPTPAVPNTSCVITRSLIAMTATDKSLSAELVCSTERARRRSRNSRNALRGTYVAVQIFRIFYSGYSLATNSITAQSGLIQNTATNTKFINILFFSTQAGCILSIISFLSELFNYIYINKYDRKEAKQFHTANDDKQQQKKGYRAVSKLETK